MGMALLLTAAALGPSRVPAVVAGSPIIDFGPAGAVWGPAQVRVRFARPLIVLESPDSTEVLAHFSLQPPMPGKFRVVGSDTVVYEPEGDFWLVITFRVSIFAAMKDIGGGLRYPLDQ